MRSMCCNCTYTREPVSDLLQVKLNVLQSLITIFSPSIVHRSLSFVGNKGCNGGVVSRALQYAKDVGFEEAETDYPYEGKVR